MNFGERTGQGDKKETHVTGDSITGRRFMSTLYQLSSEYQYLLTLAEDPETDPEVLADTLEGLEGAIESKAEGYAVVMKELEAEKAKWEAERSRADSYVKSITSNIDKMKSSLMAAMQTVGKDRIQSEHFKFSIAKNGGLRPLKITGEVSDSFMILEPKPDMKRIREALEEGFELNFAHLEERGSHLNIK